jgi:AcrR family transcriptional regulator
MRMRSDRPPFQRRSPKQARARATVEAIVEAAAQILERGGPEALNTNDVAERAGVSIGTLYQYFPDKQAILLAAARRELGATSLAGRQKALVQALIEMLERLGGQGLRVANGGMAKRGDAPTRPRRGPAFDSRWADLLAALADALAPAPELKPIPIRARRRER